MRTCCKAFQQHSNVERAQCAVSTRGSRPMRRWERVKKKARGHEEGRWVRCFQRAWQREREEGEIPDTHQQTGGRTKRELKEKKKKAGHIPQAPENVLVILGRVLLIDEWGVFKPLPLWSCSNGDCTWQAAECSATFCHDQQPYTFRSGIIRRTDGKPSCPVLDPREDPLSFLFLNNIRFSSSSSFYFYFSRTPMPCAHSCCSQLLDTPWQFMTLSPTSTKLLVGKQG